MQSLSGISTKDSLRMYKHYQHLSSRQRLGCLRMQWQTYSLPLPNLIICSIYEISRVLYKELLYLPHRLLALSMVGLIF